MQRAEALQPLSRQHKAALMTCLLVRKGVSRQAPIATIVDFIRKSWEQDIAPHMAAEENVLLPLLNSHPKGKAFAATILRDHDLIRTSITHLPMDGTNYRLLGDIADMLEQHIRYEERIVFQEMQAFIPADTLNKLHITESSTAPVCNTYPVHFWE
ncbi:hemerythrin domain-containing protein [Flavihumibacter petaseus]|uniref:Hemerythrin-like domain-containing protein n=1 Tax=Flavihumibacter petaseus NBRC 106054 TaxID=1220578 RepID=A0A0E9N2E6_9BACT|nr:hemerythrin domain-containing protein [Flavihumibacter petaseus]GAO43958.1 hypothetical protein FPE01S_02_10640 [Flavihumibacter petaseus NBRC 106054]